MALAGEGIWVQLTMEDRTQVMGFASGAESPNDFWAKFRTQLVRLDEATTTGPGGEQESRGTIYVNRDRILIVEVRRHGR